MLHLPRLSARQASTPLATGKLETSNLESLQLFGCSCEGKTAETAPTPPPTYLYALGSIRAVIPSRSVEAELLHQAPPTNPPYTSKNLATASGLLSIIGQIENLYIARELCWVLDIDGVAAYILSPATHDVLLSFIQALAASPVPGTMSFSIVVGQVGGKAPKNSCSGMELPVVMVQGLLNTNSTQLNQGLAAGISRFVGPISVPAPNATDVGEMVSTALQMMDNVGNTNTYRAMNYAMLHAGGMYGVWWCYQTGYDPATGKGESPHYSLTGVTTAPARVQGERSLIDVIFSYYGNSTTVAWSITVDVSGGIPFFASQRPTRYYSRP